MLLRNDFNTVIAKLDCHSRENGNQKHLIKNRFPLSPEGIPMAVGMTTLYL